MKQLFLKGIIALIVITITNICCNHIEKRINAPEDIEEAMDRTSKFYKLIMVNDTVSLHGYFGGSINPDQGISFVGKLKELNGEIVRYEISYVKAEVRIIGNKTEKEYYLECVVVYEKGKCKESIELTNIGESLLITSYQSNFES